MREQLGEGDAGPPGDRRVPRPNSDSLGGGVLIAFCPDGARVCRSTVPCTQPQRMLRPVILSVATPPTRRSNPG